MMTHDEQCGIDALIDSNTLLGAYLRAVHASGPTEAGMNRLRAGIAAHGCGEGEERDDERWQSDWD